MMKSAKILCLIVFLFFSTFLSNAQDCPKREMRAVWIATVNNIDWPSKPGLTTEEQQTEMIRLLDQVLMYNLNTIVFQIRPAADAFYPSSLEPWSQWLTGQQGKAQEPWYDPLDFTITECRKRGIDIHVWLNPYRAVSDTANITSDQHITKIHPDWFLTYGKTVYFDPGLPQTRDYVASVVSDIVRRYDIDAIHMDDYFYPYRITGKEFPDDTSFVKYNRGFSLEQKDDWRRDNVDLIIKQLSDSIKAIKPWVEFGISPFGVWRNIDKDPAGSKTRAGQTNYDDLFADIIKWQKEGWIDYVTPQIYWQIGKEVADYGVLLDWWSHNSFGCQVYIGQAPYRINRKATERPWKKSGEIIRQTELNRTYPNVSGSMYFSAKVLARNPLRLKEKLLRDLYNCRALTPVNNGVVPILPEAPRETFLTIENNMAVLSWMKGAATKNFVIYKFKKGRPADMNDPENIFAVISGESISFTPGKKTDLQEYYFVITSQSYSNHESVPVYFNQTGSL